MTAPHGKTPEDVARLTEASAWRVRLAEDGLESSEAFEAWCADPENAAAWDQVDGPWRRMGEEATAPELMAARIGALERARRGGRRRRLPSPLPMRLIAALLIAILLPGGFAATSWLINRPDVYRTGMGERRVVQLDDGSTVSLDSMSVVRVRYENTARQLQLMRGQARFEVAHDVERPFTVKAGDQTVVATGTAFNVDMLGPEVLVTLLEGRVTVLNLSARRAPAASSTKADSGMAAREGERPPSSMVLTPGQQLVIRPTAYPEVKPVSASRATAWEAGQIVFEDEPLSAAAARVGRYSGRSLSVEGRATELRVSGVFKAGDAATFVDAVSLYLPVEATADATGAIVLRSRS